MKLYRVVITADAGGVRHWSGDRADGHAALKLYPPATHPDARLELVDVPTDKNNILSIFQGGAFAALIEKTWMLTIRGGLKEVPNGE